MIKSINYYLLICLIFIPFWGKCQKLATLESGEKIIIYSNKTWSYLGESQPDPIEPVNTDTFRVVKSEVEGNDLLIEIAKTGEKKIETFSISIEPKTFKKDEVVEYTISIGTAIYSYRPRQYSKKGYTYYRGLYYLGEGPGINNKGSTLTLREAKNLVAQHYVNNLFIAN